MSDHRSARDRQAAILRAQLDRHVVAGCPIFTNFNCGDVTPHIFDIALPTLQIGIDVDVRPAAENIVKYNAAAIAGWIVLRFTQDMVVRGQAVHQVMAAMRYRGVVIEAE